MQEPGESRSLWSRRVRRRGVLRGGLGIVGLAVLGPYLSGCGGSSEQKLAPPSGGTPTAVAPKRGGTLITPVNSQMGDLNPMYLAKGNSSDFLIVNVYERLVNYDESTGKYDLSVAASVEVADPLTVIFKVKPTAKFQDIAPVSGRRVTSEDFATLAKAWVANPRAADKQFMTEYVDRYETPDAATLIVKLKKPNGWALTSTALGGHGFSAVPRELIDRNQLDKTAIGSGPYMLAEFDPNSTIAAVRRPDGWHGREQPYIDKIVRRVITDDAARSAALKAKQVDAMGARDKLQAEEFKGYGPDMVIDEEYDLCPMIFMRADASTPFGDVRVRQAIYKALDIQELIDYVDLGEGRWSGPVQPSFGGYGLPLNEVKQYLPHDLKAAKDLLTAAGWDTNREVPFNYPISEKTALLCQILQRQFAQVGFKTRLVPQDTNTVWLGVIREAAYEISAYHGRASKDPNTSLSAHHSLATAPRNKWSDKELDEMIERQQVEYDVDKQRQIVLEAQRLAMKKASPTIVLYQSSTLTARWGYYHLVSERGDADRLGHYSWMDTGHPAYPSR